VYDPVFRLEPYIWQGIPGGVPLQKAGQTPVHTAIRDDLAAVDTSARLAHKMHFVFVHDGTSNVAMYFPP
jgi:hypothetical protein